MRASFQVVAAGESFCVAHVGAVQIQLWRGAVALEPARRARNEAARLADEGRRGLLIVAERRSEPPRGEAKAILTELGTSLGGARGCAFVSEAEGLAAAAMRNIMRGMALLARPPFPVKIFHDVDAAARWLAEATGAAHEDELREAVSRMRTIRAMDAASPTRPVP